MLMLSMDTTPTLLTDPTTTMDTPPMLPLPTEAMLPPLMDTQAMLPLPTAMEDTPEDTMARGQLKLMLRLMLSMDTTPTLLTDHTTTMDTPPMLPLPTEATLPPLMDTPAMLPLPTAMEDTPEDTMARGLLRLSQRLMLKPSMEDMDTLPMPLPPTEAMLP